MKRKLFTFILMWRWNSNHGFIEHKKDLMQETFVQQISSVTYGVSDPLSCQSCTAEEKYSFDLRMIIWMVFSWNLDYFHHITSIMTASYVKFSSHFPILLSLSRYTMHQHLCNILPSIIINVMSTFPSDIFQHLTWYHYISSPIRCFRTDAAKYGVFSSADFKSSF